MGKSILDIDGIVVCVGGISIREINIIPPRANSLSSNDNRPNSMGFIILVIEMCIATIKPR